MISPKFVFFLVAAVAAITTANISPQDWTYPWEACVSMDQIVGRKCELLYYICDYGDAWFTHDVLCNNCIGDCPPGRVFSNLTETCVWPNTIGCGCMMEGQILGNQCEENYFVCKLLANEDWATDEQFCPDGTLYDPDTTTCQPPSEIGC